MKLHSPYPKLPKDEQHYIGALIPETLHQSFRTATATGSWGINNYIMANLFEIFILRAQANGLRLGEITEDCDQIISNTIKQLRELNESTIN